MSGLSLFIDRDAFVENHLVLVKLKKLLFILIMMLSKTFLKEEDLYVEKIANIWQLHRIFFFFFFLTLQNRENFM